MCNSDLSIVKESIRCNSYLLNELKKISIVNQKSSIVIQNEFIEIQKTSIVIRNGLLSCEYKYNIVIQYKCKEVKICI